MKKSLFILSVLLILVGCVPKTVNSYSGTYRNSGVEWVVDTDKKSMIVSSIYTGSETETLQFDEVEKFDEDKISGVVFHKTSNISSDYDRVSFYIVYIRHLDKYAFFALQIFKGMTELQFTTMFNLELQSGDNLFSKVK